MHAVLELSATRSLSKIKWRLLGVCAALILLTALVFGRVLHYPFVNFDDGYYVYHNPVVFGGLCLPGLAWVFTHGDCGLYHPLTMLSFQLDYHFNELNADGYHATNLLLHTGSVVLLFLVLQSMTGAFWRSAFVAAVFAIHPLRVESVAWVSERKDVLSAFFFMLTLAAYVHFARKSNSIGRYMLVIIAFVAAMLAKPSVVTVPFLLLLLDYWPLQRKESWGRLVMEKLPMLVLAVADSAATVLAVGKVVHSYVDTPFPGRLANAAVSYFIYVRQLVWPAGLAVFYPNPPHGYKALPVALSCLFILGLTAAAVACARKRPWVAVGWFWYLGMLLPMVGIIQAGPFAHADRMTYLTEIGLCVAVAWLTAEWLRNGLVAGLLGSAVIIALAVCSWNQVQYWRDSESLWKQALACTTDNYMAHYNLGVDALDHGRDDDAVPEFKKTLEINPDHAESESDLGSIYYRNGEMGAALAAFQAALKLRPDYEAVHFNMALALQKMGRTNEAAGEYAKYLQSDPRNAAAQFNLAVLLQALGQFGEALAHLEQAHQLRPQEPSVEIALAWLFATCPDPKLRNGEQAVELSTQAGKQTGAESPQILATLAASLAESGRFAEAAATAQRALDLAQGSDPELAASLRGQLKLYRAGRPFHLSAVK